MFGRHSNAYVTCVGCAGERYLKDVIWRVRTPGDARAALAVTELFTQHRAARLQLRTYKKYVSEKLIEVRLSQAVALGRCGSRSSAPSVRICTPFWGM